MKLSARGETRRTEPDEDDLKDGISFDKLGRMQYHPEFHPLHRKPMTMDELIYIVRFYNIDGPRSIGFALGRTEHTIMNTVCKLRKEGDWELLLSLSDEEWERLSARQVVAG